LFLAHDLVAQVLGEKWLPVVPVMQVLVLASCFQVLDSSAKALFHGIGRPMSSFCFNSLRIGILLVSAFPLVIGFGVTGAAFAVLLSGIGATPFQLMYIKSTLEIPWKHFFPALGPALALSGMVALVLLTARIWLGHPSPVSLIVVVGLALCTYVGTVFALWGLFGSGPLSMLARLHQPPAANSSLNGIAGEGVLKA
jgi:O-antigen/teichoic acid export membrane protein